MATEGASFDLSGQHIDGSQVNIAGNVGEIKLVYERTEPRTNDPTRLAAAKAVLDAMPTDALPSHASLPPGSRMPLARNPLFVGRSRELLRMASALKGGDTLALSQVVAATGLGGLGKTQLAVEFVHRYGRFFTGGVFWLSFANPEEIPLQILACAGPAAMGLAAEVEGMSPKEQLELVMGAWQSDLPRLLVFDNCEEEALLDAWRPPTGGCRVLITSRRSQWSPTLGVESLPLDLLPRPDSRALLRRYRPDLQPDDPEVDALAQEMGDLPLALHLAGSYLRTYRTEVSLADYLAELAQPAVHEHASMLGRGLEGAPSPTRHIHSLAQTFALSLGRLDGTRDVDMVAISVLARMAFLAPGQPVPRGLLDRILNKMGPLERRDGLKRLRALGLVEEGDGWLRLHRLLASFVLREGLDPDAKLGEGDEAAARLGSASVASDLTIDVLRHGQSRRRLAMILSLVLVAMFAAGGFVFAEGRLGSFPSLGLLSPGLPSTTHPSTHITGSTAASTARLTPPVVPSVAPSATPAQAQITTPGSRPQSTARGGGGIPVRLATSTPAPVTIRPCRLPVSGSTPGSGGFIQLPGGSFTGDPASNVPVQGGPDPSGQRHGYTYDPAVNRWLPAPPEFVGPGSAWYVYVGTENPPLVHRVDVATGSDTLWPGSDQLLGYVTAVASEGVYGAPGPAVLDLVDPNGRTQRVDQGNSGLRALVTPSAYFETQESGGQLTPTDLVRVDKATGVVQTWFHRPGLVISPIGLDPQGNPIVSAGKYTPGSNPIAQEIWIVPRPSVADQPAGTLLYSSTDAPLGIVGFTRVTTVTGQIYIETDHGLYVSDGSGFTKASDHVGFIAGDCIS